MIGFWFYCGGNVCVYLLAKLHWVKSYWIEYLFCCNEIFGISRIMPSLLLLLCDDMKNLIYILHLNIFSLPMQCNVFHVAFGEKIDYATQYA